MNPCEQLTSAIVGHLVGDYLLQNDWLAGNKKKPGLVGDVACWIHCSIWMFCVLLFSGWRSPVVPILLLVTHYIQDRTHVVKFWMTRINRQPQFAEPPLAPWSLIVVDNVWHIVTLWCIWRLFVIPN